MTKRIRKPTRILAILILCTLASLGGQVWTLTGGDPEGKQVLVTKVIDGDTIHVGRGWRHTKVRLIGVDTPEVVHPKKPIEFYGPEASDFTKRSLQGKWVHLETEPPNRIDAYGRLLAYVYLENGTFFNLELVRQGYARAYTRFDFRHKGMFREAEEEARQGHIGLWTGVAGRGLKASPNELINNREVRSPRLTGEHKIIGNVRSKIYHLPGQENYGRVSEANRIYFNTEEEAIRAGFKKAKM